MTTYISSLTIPDSILLNPTASILLPIAFGTAVGYGTRPAQTKKMYRELRQPPLRPPAWLFGPVWTGLYGVMGYAAYRVSSIGLSALSSPKTVQTTREAMTVYSLQLAVNLLWMPLFFGAKRPVEATVDIVTLIGLNGYLTYLYGSVDRVSALCQIPYLGWLGFATYLCVGAGVLNDWDLNEKPKQS